MKMKVRKILISFHFIALAIAVLNTLLKSLTKYGLDSQVELTIEAAAVISGFILFFFYLIPFKKINFYFSIYALLAIFSILTWVFRSFFFGFILVIALYPVFPDENILTATPPTNRNILSEDAYEVISNELYRFTFTEADYENAEEIGG